MAINLGTATGYLKINASGVRQGVQQAMGSLHSMDEVVTNMWWGLRNIGKAAATGGAAIAGAFLLSAKAAIDWEDAMAGVARTNIATGTSAEQAASQTKALSNDLLDIASQKPIEPVEIANIAEQAGALGVAQGDIKEFTSVVADLAATTNLSSEQAATDLARLGGLTGVTGDGFRYLASTIFEVGRRTAATESEITGIAQKLAGVASTVGLSADEVVAFAAAAKSAGVESSVGATAIQRTFLDMAQAIAKGGEELTVFAQISGHTEQEFADIFKNDPKQAFVDFITGLGNMGESAVKQVTALDTLGISEARQIRALTAMGKAQTQTANENIKLSTILGIANKEFQSGGAIAEITARQYATVASQLQILKNEFFKAGTIVGEEFLGPIQFAISVLSAFVRGFQALPPWIRQSLTVMLAMEAGLLAFLAAIGLVLPRMVLMNQVLDQLRGRSIAAAGATQTLAAAQRQQAGAATSAAVATAGSSKFGAAITKSGKAAGILGIVLGVAAIATTAFGATQETAGDKAEEHRAKVNELTQAIRQQSQGIGQAADEWVVYQLQTANVIGTLEALGFSLADTLALIKGTNDAALVAKFEGLKDLNEDQKKAVALVGELGTTYKDASSNAARLNTVLDDTADAHQDIGDAAEESGKKQKEAARKAYEAAQEQYDATERVNQAIIDYIRNAQAVDQANLSVAQSAQDYQRAMAELANEIVHIQLAEVRLGIERLNQQKVNADLAEAEIQLARARQQAADDLKRAELSAQDAVANLADAYDRVREAEEALNELRSGPTLDEVIDATNELADAQLRLRRATLAVEDAEWALQHLREEGAGARDLAEAQLVLDEANAEVTNTTADVQDAQQALLDLYRDPTPVEYAAAVREVERAHRDVERATLDLRDAQQELQDSQRAIATDRAYLDAQQQVLNLQADQLQNILDISNAEQSLLALQNGSLRLQATAAELAYRDALLQSAFAATDLIKSQMEMQGQFVSTGLYAQILGGQIGQMLNIVPNTGTFAALGQWRQMLFGAIDPGPPPSKEAFEVADNIGKNYDYIGGAGKKKAEEALGQLTPDPNKNPGNQKQMDDWRGNVINWILAGAAGIMVALIPGVGPILAPFAAAFVHDLLDQHKIGQGIAEGLDPDVWAGYFQNGLNSIHNALIQPIQDWATGFWNELGRQFTQIGSSINPANWFNDVFQIGSPSKITLYVGRMLSLGLAEGLLAESGKVQSASEMIAGTLMAPIDNLDTERMWRFETAALGNPGRMGSFADTAAMGGVVNEGDTIIIENLDTPTAMELIGQVEWAKRVKNRGKKVSIP